MPRCIFYFLKYLHKEEIIMISSKTRKHSNKDKEMDILSILDKMTTPDKLIVMEKLWDELCRNPDSVPSPE